MDHITKKTIDKLEIKEDGIYIEGVLFKKIDKHSIVIVCENLGGIEMKNINTVNNNNNNNNTFTVSGASYSICNSIIGTITGGKRSSVTSESDSTNKNSYNIHINVLGDVKRDIISSSGDTEVLGNVEGEISSTSGDIKIQGNVSNGVKSTSGDVNVGGIVGGNISTTSGDITTNGDCLGASISTVSGDIDVIGQVNNTHRKKRKRMGESKRETKRTKTNDYYDSD